MKKALFLFLTVLLISQYMCDDDDENLDYGECKHEKTASGVGDCENLKAGDYYKCCFVDYEYTDPENGEGHDKYCEPITKDFYDNIKDEIDKEEKAAKAAGGKADISIDCSSNYVMISLLTLILLFL